MIELTNESPRHFTGLSRRGFLRVGAFGFAGLSLADVLRANASASAAGRASTLERSVILIWLDGGPPQHETYDPSRDAPPSFAGRSKQYRLRSRRFGFGVSCPTTPGCSTRCRSSARCITTTATTSQPRTGC